MILQSSCLKLAASQTSSGDMLLSRHLSSPRATHLQVIPLSSWEDHSEGRPEGCLTESTMNGHLESMRKSPGVADGSHCLWICFNHGVAVVVRESFALYWTPKHFLSKSQIPVLILWARKGKWPWMIWVELWWKVKLKLLSCVSSSLGPLGL